MKTWIVAAVILILAMVPVFAQNTAGKTAHQDGNNVFTGTNSVTGTFAIPGNAINVDAETTMVMLNESVTLNISTGFSNIWLASIQVLTTCGMTTLDSAGNALAGSYDFALYRDEGFDSGEEQLIYLGQTLSLFDGKPPILRDADGTGEIHAKFWNKSSTGCIFRLRATGVGF